MRVDPNFGDVVSLTDGSLGIVCVPDDGSGQIACLGLNERWNLTLCGDGPEVILASSDAVHRVVGRHDELSQSVRQAIESICQ